MDLAQDTPLPPVCQLCTVDVDADHGTGLPSGGLDREVDVSGTQTPASTGPAAAVHKRIAAKGLSEA